jgi:hypothetical protein
LGLSLFSLFFRENISEEPPVIGGNAGLPTGWRLEKQRNARCSFAVSATRNRRKQVDAILEHVHVCNMPRASRIVNLIMSFYL